MAKKNVVDEANVPAGPYFDLWLYHAGSGWWLEESGLDGAGRAAAAMARHMGSGNTVAGAVLPAGQSLGLFTRKTWEG